MESKAGIKPYTKKDLATLYQLSPRAFYSMFKPHEHLVGKKFGRYYSILQVETIFARLGLPNSLLQDEFIKTKLRSST
jgi:transcriptional regulator GlxA family with amidase domain